MWLCEWNLIEGTEAYAVRGRGASHLAILIETMRREGFELSVGKPRVIFKDINGKRHEPFEVLSVERPTDNMGPVMELVGLRRGTLDEMQQRSDYSLLRFSIPARGLIGLRTRLLNATKGTAIIHHRFADYRPVEGKCRSVPMACWCPCRRGKRYALPIWITGPCRAFGPSGRRNL